MLFSGKDKLMSELKKKLRVWHKAGWDVSKTNNNHIRLVHRQTAATVFTGSTPSDRRSIINTDLQMRRALRLRETTVIPPEFVGTVPENKTITSTSQPKHVAPKRSRPLLPDGFDLLNFRKNIRADREAIRLQEERDEAARRENRHPSLPGKGQWVTEDQMVYMDQFGRSLMPEPVPVETIAEVEPEPVVVISPETLQRREILDAWRYSYLKLIAAGKDRSMINLIKDRFREDEQFREICINTVRLRMLHYRALIRKYRAGRSLNDDFMAKDHSDHLVAVPLPVSTAEPISTSQSSAFMMPLPTYFETRYSAEDVIAGLQREVKAAQDAQLAEQRERQRLEAEIKTIRQASDKALHDMRIRKGAADARCDDLLEQINTLKERARALAVGKGSQEFIKDVIGDSERRLNERINELEDRLLSMETRSAKPRKQNNSLRTGEMVQPVQAPVSSPVTPEGEPVAINFDLTNADRSAIGQRVKMVRLNEQMVQTEFATRLKVKGPVVSQWETGRAMPNDGHLSEMSRLFAVSKDWLMTGEGSQRRQGRRGAFRD